VEKLFTNYGTWADGEGRKRGGIQSVVCDLEGLLCIASPLPNRHKSPGEIRSLMGFEKDFEKRDNVVHGMAWAET